MRTNYHTHSQFCDGKVDAMAMAEAALAAGYSVLGFSSHAPLPFETGWTMKPERFPDYLAEIRRVRAVMEPRGLELLLGLEVDWIEGLTGPTRPAAYRDPGLDFRICSVHFIDPRPGQRFSIDGPAAEFDEGIEREAGGDGTIAYRAYYRALCGAIEEGGFDILGHFDLVVRNNKGGKWFDEESTDYLAAAFEAVDLLAESGAVAEVNLGPISRGRSVHAHPSLPILRRMRERGVPMTISADAHDTGHLGVHIDTARDLLAAAGYRAAAVLSRGSWREVPLAST